MSYAGPIEADVDIASPEAQAVLSGAAGTGQQPPAGQQQVQPPAGDGGKTAGQQQPPAGDGGETAAGQLVPRQRLNQVIAQRDEAKSQLAELQKQIDAFAAKQAPTSTYVENLNVDAALEKLNTLTDARDAALLEGDLDAVKALSRQINTANVELMQLQSARTVVGENYVMSEGALFAQTAETLQAQYPILDPENAGYNQGLVDTIRALSAAKLNDNPDMTEAKSLYEATTQTMALFGQVAVGNVAGKAPVNPNVARKMAAAAAQPAFLGAVGIGDNTGTEPDIEGIDVSKLTDAMWDKLTPAQRNRLLGI